MTSIPLLGDLDPTNFVGFEIACVPGDPRDQAYPFDRRDGVTTLRVSSGNAFSTLTHVLGEKDSLTSTLAVSGNTVDLDDGTRITLTSPDQIALTTRLYSGAAGTVSHRGGLSRAGGLRWQINGTEGDLLLTSPVRKGNIPATELVLAGANVAATQVVPIDTPDAAVGLTGSASTVAKLYPAFADDRKNGTTETPSFDGAVQLHRLSDGIERGHSS